MKKSKTILFSTIVVLSILSFNSFAQDATGQQTPWVAPPEADKLVNPLEEGKAVLDKGKAIYTAECVVCHGTYGNAETNIAESLEQKPKNFTKEDFLTQTDGAIFWKLSEGRGLMQPFKTMLTEEEIWSVVMYVKTLAQDD